MRQVDTKHDHVAVCGVAGIDVPAPATHDEGAYLSFGDGQPPVGQDFDLPVQVLDVFHSASCRATLVQSNGKLTLDRRRMLDTSPSLYLSPGWIDLHAHVYHGVTALSVHPDAVGLVRGVHLIADAGSAGEATLQGLIEYVMPSVRTRLRAWLNISPVGLVTMREYYDLSLLDPERTCAAALEHRPEVCGIKVRVSGLIVGGLGLEPLKLARLAARAAGLPLLVHIGEPPPLIEEVLDLLDAGDVVSHCYHGKFGCPWRSDGQPGHALRGALERGVLLDVAHGAASFSFSVAERAIAAGYPPYSISTDLHVRNWHGPVFDLPMTMSKLLAVGMPLLEVVRAVTESPARVLGEEDWCSLDGVLTQATLFRIAEGGEGRAARDSTGEERVLERWVEPVGVITSAGMEWLIDEPPVRDR